ncbi:MAG: N(4)-(beta-N-acetylglucosaminyl)-L-asparaginase [Bacteroidota bacterium]
MTNRRRFLKIGGLASLLGLSGFNSCKNEEQADNPPAAKVANKPIVISTWRHGLAANAGAWKILEAGGSALDAVEAGVRVTESDPETRTVGLGGRPDMTGVVSLDACIMDEKGDCGSVAFLQDIENPISVARKVMEETPHVMLVGEGAKKFALEQGFEEKNLLTEASRKDWEAWMDSQEKEKRAKINVENHDTIGLLALDDAGNLSGACTTSGAAWKLHGRVGDSPIIGAGLYVDNEVGGATATGWGEAVIRAVGCFLVVEFMRQGLSPEEACKQAVERVISKNPDWKEIQVGFLALNKAGEHGSYCIQKGFDYALQDKEHTDVMIKAKSKI